MDQSLTSTSVHVQVARSLLAVNYVIAVNATLAIVNTVESWMQELANALVVTGHGVEIVAQNVCCRNLIVVKVAN